MGLPDRRQNTYEALEKKLDGHISAIEEKFDRWFRRGLIIMAFIGLCCAAAIGGTWIALGEIQDTREEFVRSQCESQNKHNKDTSAQLIGLAALDEKRRKTEAGKEEVRNRRDVTLALIEALAPKQDCDFLVRVASGKATPTPEPSPIPSPTLSPKKP
jgi:hypothetical protein